MVAESDMQSLYRMNQNVDILFILKLLYII